MPTLKRIALLLASLAFTPSLASVVLVTEQEFTADLAAPEPIVQKALPNPRAPRILLLMPDVSAPVDAPVNIRLQFQPQADAEVDPATLHVYYGRLGIDITSRILAKATPTKSGLAVDGASVPSGHHRLAIEIKDTRGETGRLNLEFEVK